MRNAHCRTWNMARKLKIREFEIHTLGRDILRGKLKMLENLKCPLQDVEYGKKTENHGKPETSNDDLKNEEFTEKHEK